MILKIFGIGYRILVRSREKRVAICGPMISLLLELQILILPA